MSNQLYKSKITPPMVGVDKVQLVEVVVSGVPVTGNQLTKIQFQDQPYLRNKRICGLEMFNFADIPASPIGNPVISAAQMQATSFTAYSDTPEMPGVQGEWLQAIPAIVMHRVQNATPTPFVRNIFTLKGQVFSWDKCYFTLSAPLGNLVDTSFLLLVYFMDNIVTDANGNAAEATTA
jgi:hypothetical protein